MKHSFNILVVLVLFFLASQVVGLLVTKAYIDVPASLEKGETVWKSLPSIAGMPFERPEVSPSVIAVYLMAGIILGTLLVWLFSRVQYFLLWKIWFFLAVLLCLYISFFAFLSSASAFFLALVLSTLKIFRPSIVVHNLTELFLYGGLSAIFVPLMSLSSAFVLIVLISLYDIYAVWKSHHMIALAKFQMKAQLFAGLLIPYKIPKLKKERKGEETRKKIKIALLGGGDIAFPLLFSGVVMKSVGFWQSLIISLCTSIALFLLIYFGKKDKFYPAMPVLGFGCFVGYGIILLLQLL